VIQRIRSGPKPPSTGSRVPGLLAFAEVIEAQPISPLIGIFQTGSKVLKGLVVDVPLPVERAIVVIVVLVPVVVAVIIGSIVVTLVIVASLTRAPHRERIPSHLPGQRTLGTEIPFGGLIAMLTANGAGTIHTAQASLNATISQNKQANLGLAPGI
jgi:hypothetical protein